MQTNISSPNRRIIQGGMGVYISNPFFARTVSMLGGQGTVSLVAPERIMAKILQSGDFGGHYRRALAHFPFPEYSELVLKEFFIEHGDSKGLPKRAVPAFTVNPSKLLIALTVCANFAFVWLAKEGHDNPISGNYLEKIQMPHIYAITGAMMAGLDYVTMGAGRADQIPQVMRDIEAGKEASYNLDVIGSNIKKYKACFDPGKFFGAKLPPMKVPGFLPIIASNLLADVFMKLPEGYVDGFAVEHNTAGGHNAGPRTIQRNEKGEAIVDEAGDVVRVYGFKDDVDFKKLADLGLPFWIGGSYASPEKLRWALSVGATGIQAGSIFALCEESGMRPDIRERIRELGFDGKLGVKTDMRVSPTGFPFKVAKLEGTMWEPQIYESRQRICNQGALVSLYERPDGSIGYRCASEPIDDYIRKGGKLEETVGRGCICNGLISTTALQNPEEPPIVTLGEDVSFLRRVMCHSMDSYSAKEALAYLQGLNC